MQDQVGGLEVKHREKGWVQATPIEGTFVVNIGDVMMNWTNGRYVSNLHRVVNRKAQARMSLPHFANADYDAIIAPIPALIEPGSDPITGPIHFGQYMDEFYKGRWTADPPVPRHARLTAHPGGWLRQDRQA
jgi:isopenicillin N synthase-like dioxygenase